MLLIEELLISPLSFLLVVIFIAFIGWWVFAVKKIVLGDKFWRISNFIIIVITCFGVLGVVKDSRSFLFEREYEKRLSRIDGVYHRRLLSNLDAYPFCFYIDSTSLINDIHDDYYITTKWIEDNKGYISDCICNKEQINIDRVNFPMFKNTDPAIENYFENIKVCVTNYNTDISELRKYENGQNSTLFELLYLFLSPLFISIGIGWEFVKFFAKR